KPWSPPTSAPPLKRRVRALDLPPNRLRQGVGGQEGGSHENRRKKTRPSDLLDGKVRWLLFGGKGGVGKTTCAAATALDLARRDPARRLLLLSMDPAHSLGDVFGAALGDHAHPVRGGPPNLHVREIDAAAE